jgi:hypothetical protein
MKVLQRLAAFAFATLAFVTFIFTAASFVAFIFAAASFVTLIVATLAFADIGGSHVARAQRARQKRAAVGTRGTSESE